MPILWDNIRNRSSTHTFQSALLGAVQREVLKASGSHAEIFSACESPIHTDHLARPFFSGPNVKEKKGSLGGETSARADDVQKVTLRH